MAKRYQAIDAYEREFKKQRVLQDSLELRDWQQQLYDELVQEPGDRIIHWYCDPTGGAGKSRFAKYITRQFPNTLYVDGGGARDVKTAFEGQSICLVNLPRTVEGYVPYKAIECLKDGVVFKEKYDSRTECYPSPHVIVFANFGPEYGKISDDRLNVIHLS